MKLRNGVLALLALALVSLVAAGCGDDDKKSDKKDSGSKASSAAAKVDEAKRTSLDNAKKAYDKKKSVDNCRSLAMSYIAVASPESPKDPKDAPKLPKDRDKNLKSAVGTLEDCVKLDNKNRDVKQMLSSTYMATGKYEEAADLLQDLAKSAKGPERANAYYAWGLAASNGGDYASAISAWTTFQGLAPKRDPRIAQVKQAISALKVAQRSEGQAKKADTSAAATKGGDTAKGDDEDKGGDDEG